MEAIIFITAISEYDQVLFEDETTVFIRIREYNDLGVSESNDRVDAAFQFNLQ